MLYRPLSLAAATLAVGTVAPAVAAPRVIDVPATLAAPITRHLTGGNGDPVPVRVPGRLPVDVTATLRGTGGTAGGGYVFRIETPGCQGANACAVARFAGDPSARVTGPRAVVLVRGIRGRFTPMTCAASCAPPRIAWREDGVTYTLAVRPIGRRHRAELVRLANQAIVAGPISASRQARQVDGDTPTSRVRCSPSGDTCTGIYLRKGRIVVRKGYVERYMVRDRLCLRGPDTTMRCRTVRLRTRGSTFFAHATFTLRGPGVYRVPGAPGVQLTVAP